MRSCSLSVTTTALSKEWGFSVGRDTVPMPSWRTSETRHGEGSRASGLSSGTCPSSYAGYFPGCGACSVAQSCLTLRDPVDCSLPGSSPWDSSGKNTGVGIHALFQGIFPSQGSNPYLLHWQGGSLPLSHLGSWPWLSS